LYFFRIKERLEHALALQKGAAVSMMGRDVYSLIHFPMLCGLIIYAYAIEEALTHPNEPLTFSARFALALGIFLFSGSLVIAYWRATGKILGTRLISICLIAASCILIGNIGAIGSMAIVLAGLITLCLMEH
jgi:low temperature requirement protein LtrA